MPAAVFLPRHELSGVEVEPSARTVDQLADPRAGKEQRGQEGTPAVALMLGQLALPSARRVEHVDAHVGLEERPARLRHLHPPASSPRRVRVEQPVLDGVVEDLGEQVEDHVDGPGQEATAHELLAELVDVARVKLGGCAAPQVAQDMPAARPRDDAAARTEAHRAPVRRRRAAAPPRGALPADVQRTHVRTALDRLRSARSSWLPTLDRNRPRP
jgi:hypothetical protein